LPLRNAKGQPLLFMFWDFVLALLSRGRALTFPLALYYTTRCRGRIPENGAARTPSILKMGNIGSTTRFPVLNGGGTLPAKSLPAPRGDTKSSFLRVSLLILSLSFFLALTYLAGIYRTAANAACIGLLIYTLVTILQRDEELRRNPLHPLSYVLLGLLLTYGFRAVLLEGLRLEIPYPGSALEHLQEACILMTVAALLYYAGYRSRVAATLARRIPLICFPKEKDDPKRLLRRGYVLFAVGLLAKLTLVGNGAIHLGGPLDPVFLRYKIFWDEVSQFCMLAYMALAALALTRRVAVLWLLPLAAAQVYAGFLDGGASGPFLVFIYTVIVFSYYVKAIRWPVVIGATALVLLVLAPLAYSWRDAYETVLVRGKAGSETLTESLVEVARAPNVGGQRMRALERFGDLDIFLTVLDRVPRIYPYQGGDTFVPYLLNAVIPRALWPGKPFFDVGHRFSILFRDDPEKRVAEKGTFIGIGNVGELYFNFGYWGLAFCPLFGMFVRFFWERWKYYFQSESCASIRLPYLIFVVAGFGREALSLAAYVIGIVKNPVTIFVFMALFYGRIPTVLRWNSSRRAN